MRTTIDLDEDVLHATKELAAMRGQTAGQVLSALARTALAPKHTMKVRNGVPLLPRRPGAKPVTMEMVNRLRDTD